MISETRKKAVKAFNRRLKKATGIEKEILMEFVKQSGITPSGNLSTKSIASTQSIKSFTKASSKELSKKLESYNKPKRKLTMRERAEREQRFRERHGLQYTSVYQQTERILQNPLATDKYISKYAKHTKIDSKEFEKLEMESLINKLRYFAYKETSNSDAKEMTDLLDKGIRNIDKEELKAKLNEIYNRNRQLVDEYSADLDVGGISIISLARE